MIRVEGCNTFGLARDNKSKSRITIFIAYRPKKYFPTLPFGMKYAKFENCKSKNYEPLW